MRRSRIGALAALPLGILLLAAGCSDVGDTTATPPGMTTGDDSAAADGNVQDAGELGDGSSAGPDATVDAADAAMTMEETDGAADSTVEGPESGEPETGSTEPETGSTEPETGSTEPETGSTEPETGAPEASAPETGAPEASAPETGAPEAGGVVDAGMDSTVAIDSGPPDSGVAKDGGADSAVDSGLHDSGSGEAEAGGNGGAPTACTSAPCAASGPNSVKCDANTNNVCTPTEALIVAYDIAAGKLHGGTLDTAMDATGSCYECLASNGGIDDSQGDHGLECADVTGSATLTGESGTQACLDTLSCLLTTHCTDANPPADCLCGSATGTACLTAGAANGPCLQNELNGLDVTTGCPSGGCGSTLGSLKEGDPTTIQEAFTNTALGSGQANTLLGFAFGNCNAPCIP
jgi:hypothetical protein